MNEETVMSEAPAEEGNDQEVAEGTEVPVVEEADLEDAPDNGEEEDGA
jgi:hypothetical protein